MLFPTQIVGDEHSIQEEAFRSRVSEDVSAQIEAISASDANSMWNFLAGIIRDAVKDSLGEVLGSSKTHMARRESWWLCEEVQSKVAEKQARFRELLSCQEEKAYEDLYKKLDSKEGANEIFRIAKARQRKRRDLRDICFIKDEGGQPEGHEGVVDQNTLPLIDCYYLRISQTEEDILWCMIFVDDIVLVSELAEGLNDRLENWRGALEANGLRVSREKTEYLRCDFSNSEIAHNEEVEVCIGDKILQPKESFRYLGSMLHKSGRIDEDVAHRIKAAWLKPAMLYGSECWPITKALANRMEVAELRMLRWTCGKTMLDMIPNGVYRAELEVETIINKMREGRLRWFGHVRRRPQSAPVRRVEALVVDGMRRRGRPKLRWEDRVKLDMKELLLSEDMTSDRNEWRARTSFACEWFACLVSFLLSLFGFCVLDSDRLERWASFRLGGSMEGFEGLVGLGLPLFASSSLALWCSLLPFPFACFGACVLPCFACPFAVALCWLGLQLF
ncbi:hypothetical protein Tco_0163873 [Tanacetum coccineum]